MDNNIEISKRSIDSRWIQLIIYILFALGPLTGNVILVLFGTLSVEFGVNPSQLSIAIPAFMFPFAIVQLFSGALSDVKGRFPLMLIGLIIFGISMTTALISISFLLYLLANLLGGIGFGLVNPVLIALMTDISSGPKIPKRMGLLGSVANLGVGLGPLIAGQLALISWRILYLIFLIITIGGFIFILKVRSSEEKVIKEKKFSDFFYQLKSEITNLGTILMILSSFLISFTYLATTIWTSREFTNSIPESLSGLLIGSIGIMGAVSAFIIGQIIKKYGLKYAIGIGLITLFTGLISLLFIGDVTNLSLLLIIIISLMLIGIAGGSFFPGIMFYSQTRSKEKRGALAGLATAGQFIGIALVPIFFEPFNDIGGIFLVYLLILLFSIIQAISMILLYKETMKA
ncbi:MAG: MFS transporter [Candidatus Lokiarchaeota archaeon]|nr:MFS transporter [Candidatus Lokiarchaeota archaeon]MBD3201887.1 MFS transporter [Candidatus Lokiarchaeota archaeon]